ncbi:hypothetical protein [Pseudoalteromonas sp. MMG005]|uniref:hypothetical protein n=1 Tax=Pseudoalteromonas sp. MMG005 TaxID=2822682 RepID=UPI001B39E7C6|nr:hypothetical protein [Pseudoalteromonas sp. MMG005]MBQ4848215.1 hypothetical protein [Pseudoalteromonas sp. MMG005]
MLNRVLNRLNNHVLFGLNLKQINYSIFHILFAMFLIVASIQVQASKVNSQSRLVGQVNSSVSALSDGGYVVAWYGTTQTNTPFTQTHIFAQRYHADGSFAGSEIQVSTQSLNYSEGVHTVAVKGLDNGNFVITWNADKSIMAKLFDISGNAIGSEFLVKSVSSDYYINPKAYDLDQGKFMISWGEGGKTYTQRYHANGTVNNLVEHNNEIHSYFNIYGLDTLTQERYVLTWWQGSQIYNQIFSEAGSAITNIQQFSPQNITPDFQTISVSGLNDGGFVVAWGYFGQKAAGGESSDIFIQRFNTQGVAIGNEYQLTAPFVGANHFDPVIKSLDDGGYVIAWESYGAENTMSYRQFDANNLAVDAIQSIRKYSDATQYYGPMIDVLPGNRLLVSYHNSGFPLNDAYAQQFQLGYSNLVSLSSLPQSMLVGEEYSFDILVAGSNIYGADVRLTNSSAGKIKITSGSYGNVFPLDKRIGLPEVVTDNEWSGALSLIHPAPAITGQGVFATVSMKAEQAGTVTLNLTAELANNAGQMLLSTSTPWSFTIEEAQLVTGNVSALGFSGDYSQTRVFVNGISVEISADGTFSVNLASGEVVIRVESDGYLPAEKSITVNAGEPSLDLGNISLVAGDSNANGQIDIADLTLLLGAYRSTLEGGAPYTPKADFNRDTKINVQDLTLLGNHYGKSGVQTW